MRRSANDETDSYGAVVFFVGSEANNALPFWDSLDRSPDAHISLCHPCVVDNHIVLSIEEFQSLGSISSYRGKSRSIDNFVRDISSAVSVIAAIPIII